jgi:hypothetical protein
MASMMRQRACRRLLEMHRSCPPFSPVSGQGNVLDPGHGVALDSGMEGQEVGLKGDAICAPLACLRESLAGHVLRTVTLSSSMGQTMQGTP